MRFEWKSEKNAWLRQHRGISFDEIVVHFGRGDIWKTSPHPNRRTYPHQSIAFVVVDDYVYLVPFDLEGEVIHLRTIIPSRKATRQYLEDKRRRP
jgi:uncharacterized DUF497 family protein